MDLPMRCSCGPGAYLLPFLSESTEIKFSPKTVKPLLPFRKDSHDPHLPCGGMLQGEAAPQPSPRHAGRGQQAAKVGGHFTKNTPLL